MVRSLPKDTQNSLQNLLQSGYSYSQIMKRIPGIKKSTIIFLHNYKRKRYPNSPINNPGRPALLGNTTQNYIRK
ncbi:hypothetical protein BDF21DRAFT_320021, partial [Thamnidium elegans]